MSIGRELTHLALLVPFTMYLAYVVMHCIQLRARLPRFLPIDAVLKRAAAPRVTPERIGFKSIDDRLQKADRFRYLIAEYTYRVNGRSYESSKVVPGESHGVAKNFEAAAFAKLKTALASPTKALVAYYNPTNPAEAYLMKEMPLRFIALPAGFLVAVVGVVALASKRDVSASEAVLWVAWGIVGATLITKITAWYVKGLWERSADL